MNKVLAVIAWIGITVSSGFGLASAAAGYAAQTVTNVTIVHVPGRDYGTAFFTHYHHGSPGVIAVAAVCGFSWVAFTAFATFLSWGIWTDFR